MVGRHVVTIPPVIWMYWDQGPHAPRAAYLDLCEQTIDLHAGDMTVRVLSADTARDVIPHLPDQWEQLSPVHRSDVLRAHLLYTYGGVWLDVDTVAIQPVQALVDLAEGSDFATFPEGDGAACTGVILARPGSLVARVWMSTQKALLERNENLGWATLGSDALMPALLSAGGSMLPLEIVSPVEWRDWEVFMSPTYPLDRILVGGPVMVSFFNAFMGPVLADVTRTQVDRSPLLYARVLRYAHSGQRGRSERVRTAFHPLTAGIARAEKAARFRLRRGVASLRTR